MGKRHAKGCAVTCAAVVAIGLTGSAPTTAESDSTADYAPLHGTPERAARMGSDPLSDGSLRASTPWRGGVFSDPNDASSNARDLRTTDAYLNRKGGVLKAVGTFQSAPKRRNTVLAVYLGNVSGGDCKAGGVVVVPTRGGQGFWARFGAGGGVVKRGTARSDLDADRTVATASAPGLKGVPTKCTFAVVSSRNGERIYDQTGFIRSEAVDPALEQYGGTSPHTGVVVGKRKTLRVGVRNNPDLLSVADVTNLRVFIRGSKGTTPRSGSTRLGKLEFYDDKTATFKVRQKKRRVGTVRWTAVGDYGITSGTFKLHPLRSPMKIRKSLVGKRFWAPHDLQWKAYGVWFVNKRFAYIGFPKQGEPRCKKVTSNGNESGCVRYRFRPRKDKVTIAGKKGKIKKGRIVWRGRRYNPLGIPKAGSRWTLWHRHVNATTSGTLEYLDLELKRSGRFRTNRTVFARASQAARLPEGKGTYKVKKHGHLVLRYRSGKTVHQSIGVLTNGSRRPNPWDTGLMIGNTYYDR